MCWYYYLLLYIFLLILLHLLLLLLYYEFSERGIYVENIVLDLLGSKRSQKNMRRVSSQYPIIMQRQIYSKEIFNYWVAPLFIPSWLTNKHPRSDQKDFHNLDILNGYCAYSKKMFAWFRINLTCILTKT